MSYASMDQLSALVADQGKKITELEIENKVLRREMTKQMEELKAVIEGLKKELVVAKMVGITGSPMATPEQRKTACDYITNINKARESISRAVHNR